MATSEIDGYQRWNDRPASTLASFERPRTLTIDTVTASIGAVAPIIVQLSQGLHNHYLRLFRLSLSSLGIFREQMLVNNEAEIFKPFTELFLDVLYRKLGDLQATIDFACCVLNKFNCTTHQKKSSNLQQFASAKAYNMKVRHPEVDHRLNIAISLYNMELRERQRFMTKFVNKDDINLATDRITSVCDFVQLMCDTGNASLDTPISGLQLVSTPRWTGKVPPDTIRIYSQPKKRTPSKKTVCKVLGPICNILTISMVATLVLGLATFLKHPKSLERVTLPVYHTFFDNQPFPICIKPDDGFHPNGSINLSSTAPVNIHKLPCRNIMNVTNKISCSGNLTATTSDCYCIPLKHHCAEHAKFTCNRSFPENRLRKEKYKCLINLAPGSVLNFTVSATNDNHTEWYCLKVCLFHFDVNLNDLCPGDTPACNTSCQPMGRHQHRFEIKKQGLYYVQLNYSISTKLNYSISTKFHISFQIAQVSYNTNGSFLACNALSPMQPCIIQTCNELCFNYKKDPICLLAALTEENFEQSNNITYESKISLFLGYRVPTFLTGVIFLIIFIISTVALAMFGFYYCVMSFVDFLYGIQRDTWASLM